MLVIVIGAFVLGTTAVMCIDSYAHRIYPSHPVSDTRPLTEFRDFPVYWLGTNYEGLPLTELDISPSYITVGYGYCTMSGGLLSSACQVPLVIDERPACDWLSYPSMQNLPPTLPGFAWGRGVGVSVAVPTQGPSERQVLSDLKLANDAYFSATPLVDTSSFAETLRADCATPSPTPVGTPARE